MNETDQAIEEVRAKGVLTVEGIQKLCSLVSTYLIAKPDHTTRAQQVEVFGLVLCALSRFRGAPSSFISPEALSASLAGPIQGIKPENVALYLQQRLEPLWELNHHLYDGYERLGDENDPFRSLDEEAFAEGFENGVRTCVQELQKIFQQIVSDPRPFRPPSKEDSDLPL